MAGSFISIDVLGDGDIAQALNRLIKQANSLEPAFRDIGEHLLESHEKRFQDEEAPDGTPWELLSINTLENKALTHQSEKILRGYGTLADTLNYQINGNQLQFGSPMEYAATHQFGRDSANIPARPFLGLSNSDEDEVLSILNDFLSEAL